MKYIIIFTIVNLVLSPLAVLAQAGTQISEKEFNSDLDAYIRRSMEAIPELPSVAMVVVKDDKPIFIRAYGLANKEMGTKADADTLYYIASSTKSYMALAAVLLDREGRIKLSDPMTKYAPGVTFKTAIPDKVTIKDLLTHTSGLRNSPLVWRTAFTGEIDDKDILRVFAEGTNYEDQNYGKYAYTNLGYNIYAVLLNLSLGKKWQDVLQEKVFAPIGLKQTSAYVSKARAAKLSLAESYLFSPDTGTVIRSPIDKQDNNMQSAGGIFTSISDLSRWLRVNMNNGRLDGKQVIPAEVMQSVHTGYADTVRDSPPFTGNGKYGLGWQIGKYRNENVVYHHGGYPGWSSHISYMPDKKIGVAVMINESTAGGRIGHLLATYAYDRWLGTETPENYAKQLQELAEQYGKMKQAQIASVRSRSTRTSQLTKPLADYAGRYSNHMLGNIDIVVEQNTLGVRMGYLRVVSTPFTEKETIRVEMNPGQGDVIKFDTNSDGKIDSLTYAGMKFAKVIR
ncbi:MAG TPA: serine hydrolase [Pyrinomonadaceae bacterium]|jgi:CubicO group peptidase (beta-lactamase class C family)